MHVCEGVLAVLMLPGIGGVVRVRRVTANVTWSAASLAGLTILSGTELVEGLSKTNILIQYLVAVVRSAGLCLVHNASQTCSGDQNEHCRVTHVLYAVHAVFRMTHAPHAGHAVLYRTRHDTTHACCALKNQFMHAVHAVFCMAWVVRAMHAVHAVHCVCSAHSMPCTIVQACEF